MNVAALHDVLEEQVYLILSEKNSFFRVPRSYKLTAETIEEIKKTEGRLLLSVSAVSEKFTDKTHINDTCFSFLQDMGIILFNRNTQMICLEPQLLAKALACFVMPVMHEQMVYGTVAPQIKELSILPHSVLQDRLLLSNVATPKNLLEVIECLQQFDFCYKLNSKEEKVYGLEGYLFPFMRKKSASFVLETPTSTESVLTIGVIFVREDSTIGSNFFFRLEVIARYDAFLIIIQQEVSCALPTLRKWVFNYFR